MICRFCGSTQKDDAAFCTCCGGQLQSNNHFKSESDTHFSTISSHADQKRTRIKTVIWCIVVLVLIRGMVYLRSDEFLEKRLNDTIWYTSIEYSNNDYYYDYDRAYSICFDDENYGEYCTWVRRNGDWDNDKDTVSWRILDDKTLIIDGEYLQYETDWELSSGTLHIKNGHYEGRYSKDRPWR